MWFLGLLVLAGVLYFLYVEIQYRELRKAKKRYPGPTDYPIVGTTFPFLFLISSKDIFEKFLSVCDQYERFLRFCFGYNFILIIKEFQDVEIILSSNVEIDKGEIYDLTKPWIGEGLLTSTGAKWRKHRKILTPTFHFKILEQFLEVFNRNGQIMCELLEKEVNQEPFNVYNYINVAALDNICETAMGVNMNIQRSSDTTFLRAIKDMCYVLNKRAFTIILKPDFIWKWSSLYKRQQAALKILHSTTENMIKQRRKEFEIRKSLEKSEEKNDEDEIYQKKKMAFLDLLLESAGTQLTDKEIREEVDTFMFEGHDTVSSGLSYAICALAKHPEIQEKVFKEQQDIFGDTDRLPTYSDIQSMKYLEMVIKESQRLFPSVPVIVRQLKNDVELPGGHHVPKGSQISILIYSLHRDPKVWPDPEKFDPERFTLENTQSRNPYAYVPFSAGARNCIGQKFAMLEMKSTISKLVRKYKLIESPYEKHKINQVAELVLMSTNGFHIKIQTRD